jgi:hypothetical protein
VDSVAISNTPEVDQSFVHAHTRRLEKQERIHCATGHNGIINLSLTIAAGAKLATPIRYEKTLGHTLGNHVKAKPPAVSRRGFFRIAIRRTGLPVALSAEQDLYGVLIRQRVGSCGLADTGTAGVSDCTRHLLIQMFEGRIS